MSDSSNSPWWLLALNKVLTYAFFLSFLLFIYLINSAFSKETEAQSRTMYIYIASAFLVSYVAYFALNRKIFRDNSTTEANKEYIYLFRILLFYVSLGVGLMPVFSLFGTLSPALLASFGAIILAISTFFAIMLKNQSAIERIPMAVFTIFVGAFYLLIGPLHLVRHLLITVDRTMGNKLCILFGGALCFTIGIMLGNSRGSGRGPRTIVFKSQVPYFLVALVLGFVNPWVTGVVNAWTAFLPKWLSLLLWASLIGVLCGLPVGYRLGRSFVINVKYNRTPNVYHTGPSAAPALAGVIIGLVLFIFLIYKS